MNISMLSSHKNNAHSKISFRDFATKNLSARDSTLCKEIFLLISKKHPGKRILPPAHRQEGDVPYRGE